MTGYSPWKTRIAPSLGGALELLQPWKDRSNGWASLPPEMLSMTGTKDRPFGFRGWAGLVVMQNIAAQRPARRVSKRCSVVLPVAPSNELIMSATCPRRGD